MFYATVAIVSLLSHAFESICFAPSHKDLAYRGPANGFCPIPASMPGIGLLASLLVLNRLLAIASFGLPQKTVLPLIFN